MLTRSAEIVDEDITRRGRITELHRSRSATACENLVCVYEQVFRQVIFLSKIVQKMTTAFGRITNAKEARRLELRCEQRVDHAGVQRVVIGAPNGFNDWVAVKVTIKRFQ